MPTTRRQSKSATKIQAATRGRQTRRRLKSNKSSRKSSPKSSPRECPICLEEINKKDASKIQCSNKHLYHDKCIKEWMKHKTECPLCKENLLPDNKRKIVELLQTVNMEESEQFGDSIVNFMNKLYATGEYDKKKISKIEDNIINLSKEYIDLFGALDNLNTNESEIDFLSRKKDGVKILRRIISTFKSVKDDLKKQISKYPVDRLDERKIGIYNLELLEKPRRRIDAISRPGATERARVVRYTRSE
jgi:hypothetical protein